MEVFLTPQAAEAFKAHVIKMQGGGGDKIDQEARWRGSVLRLSAWNVNSVVMCSGKRFSSVSRGDEDGFFDGCERPASLPLCVQAGRVEILEETGCAVGTDLEDVNKTVEVRAALGGVNHMMLLKRLKAWYSFVGGGIADAGGLRGVGNVGSILLRGSMDASDDSDSAGSSGEEDDEVNEDESTPRATASPTNLAPKRRRVKATWQ
ncbi:hypothetical protein TrRE_jg12003 [Triparma retinervis]|uniref:Uncharacterized protein n=1 Tax=Triparma retinervis TaxID=2557542 RepID=A0A9W7E010_9STRA|nr:hypothetical protein TrRE_jg12003 [Triparma retinervis]